jgi:LPXTG-site transpeptidase (sortase) family protein
MLPKSGVIYLSEKMPDGNRVTIMVEETPDDVSVMPAFSEKPRLDLRSFAHTSVTPAAVTDSTSGSRTAPVRRPVPPQKRPAPRLHAFGPRVQPKGGITASGSPIPGTVTLSETMIPHMRENPVEDLDLKPDRSIDVAKDTLAPSVTLPFMTPAKPESVERAPVVASVQDSVLPAPRITRNLQSAFKRNVQPEKTSVREVPPIIHGTRTVGFRQKAAFALIALSLGGVTAPMIPKLRLETYFAATRTRQAVSNLIAPQAPELPPASPVVFNPLIAPDGSVITPVNTDFSIIVPKVGINAPVTAGVNAGNPTKYNKVLETSVAHANTSFLPDQNGTVYLFSHSTNYDWFVRDLNAVFYLLKNLEQGDFVVVVYKDVRYTYELKEKRVVKPNQVAFLAPRPGEKKLILQTCWPPGSVSERLLLFADLVEEQSQSI